MVALACTTLHHLQVQGKITQAQTRVLIFHVKRTEGPARRHQPDNRQNRVTLLSHIHMVCMPDGHRVPWVQASMLTPNWSRFDSAPQASAEATAANGNPPHNNFRRVKTVSTYNFSKASLITPTQPRQRCIYGIIDSYQYDASEGEVCVTPKPVSESRLPHHHEARHVLDATEEISAILMQKLENFQDLRVYQREKSRSRDELQNMKNEMMQELCMAKEQMLEELASATMARMEGVEACLPQPPSEPRPRPPSPQQPGSHAVPRDVTEAAPETEPLQVELLPNAKLASQIAPSRCYMHNKRETDKTRKSGESLQRKVLALGEICNVFGLTMYWNIVHARMEMAMYVPGGQEIPDLDQVVRSLRGRQARVTQRARVFRTSRPVQKPSFKLSHARNTRQGSAGRALRSQRQHSKGAGHPGPQPMASLTGRPPSTQGNIDGSFAVQQGAQSTHPPRDGVAEGSATELSMGCNERLDSPMCDAVAGDANGFEVAGAAIGTGMVAMAGASQPTALEPDRCQPGSREEGISDMSAESPNPESDASGLGNGHVIGLHQEMEGLHGQDGDAGDSSAEMPNMPPTILAQETDAGGPAIEGPRGPQPRCGSPFVGYPGRAASLARSFAQGPTVESRKGRGPHEVSMDVWGIQSRAKTSLDYILT
ncbi:hypothetical protein PG995_005404 [Apiospora arundinis]